MCIRDRVQGVGAKALQFVKQHKKGTIIVVASAVAVGAGAWVCNKVKKHEPKVVTEFRASLKSYIDAIRKGEDVYKRQVNVCQVVHVHRCIGVNQNITICIHDPYF